MSTLKSVNWALAWRRGIWTVVWAAMMALLVVMCLDLAASQPVIFGLVMLAAFVGSIGLAYTRISWHNGAYATAAAALLVSILAIFTHAFMEASYWSSVIDQINQEVSAETAVSDARAAVAEKRKERYVASSNGKSTSQLEAEIKAAETNVIYARSVSCDKPTASESRTFCEGYFLLKAKLAAAKEADKLEGMVWSAATTVETTAKRNLAAIAILAAKTLGGKAEEYTAIIVITLVAFTQALLAFALPIGWAPEKPRSASRAGGETGGYLAPEKSLSASPRPRIDALTKISGVTVPEDHVREATKMVDEQPVSIAYKSVVLPEIDPDGDGNPAPAPAEDVAEEPTNVVPLRSDHPTKAELRIEKGQRATENSVSRWLRDNTAPAGRNSKGIPAHKLIDNYASYCRQRNETPLSKRKFSTVLRGELDLPKLRGADGKRKSAVMMFPLELVAATAKRRVA